MSSFTQLIHNERTARYPDEEYYMLAGGPGGVYLADQISQKMDIEQTDRVLDLGPGHLVSSIFIGKEFGCTVFAYDLWVEATYNYQTIKRYQLEDKVIPIHGDVRSLPFSDGYFDKILAMDSYHYYGKTDAFTSYIAKFLKPNGVLGIGGPCLVSEDKAPAVAYYDTDHEIEMFETPGFWENHLKKGGHFAVQYSGIAEKGWEMWIDYLEKTYEIGLQPMWGNDDPAIIEKYKRDESQMLSNHVTIAKKVAG